MFRMKIDKEKIKERMSYNNSSVPTQLNLFEDTTNEETINSHILTELKVVIIGFDKLEKKRLKERIEELGGIVVNNVSKNVSYVFRGDDPNTDKIEEISKLRHNGYSIPILYKEDIELFFSNADKYTIENKGKKNLDFTMKHFQEHHMKIYQNGEISIPNKRRTEGVRKEFFNPFSMKYFYFGKGNTEEFFYLAQLIGNLGGCLEKEITTDTQIYILSDSTLSKLEIGEKDDTILNIQNHYNKSKATTFDLTFVSLSEVIGFIRLFIDKFQERSTIELYNKYINSTNHK